MATKLSNAAAYMDKVLEQHAEMVRLLSLAAWDSIISMSPVDTGRFRGNWNLTVGSPSLAVDYEKKDKAPPRPEVPTLAPFPVVYIANGLPYAGPLEAGWSGQAPQGMVRLTLQRLARANQGAFLS